MSKKTLLLQTLLFVAICACHEDVEIPKTVENEFPSMQLVINQENENLLPVSEIGDKIYWSVISKQDSLVIEKGTIPIASFVEHKYNFQLSEKYSNCLFVASNSSFYNKNILVPNFDTYLWLGSMELDNRNQPYEVQVNPRYYKIRFAEKKLKTLEDTFSYKSKTVKIKGDTVKTPPSDVHSPWYRFDIFQNQWFVPNPVDSQPAYVISDNDENGAFEEEEIVYMNDTKYTLGVTVEFRFGTNSVMIIDIPKVKMQENNFNTIYIDFDHLATESRENFTVEYQEEETENAVYIF